MKIIDIEKETKELELKEKKRDKELLNLFNSLSYEDSLKVLHFLFTNSKAKNFYSKNDILKYVSNIILMNRNLDTHSIKRYKV